MTNSSPSVSSSTAAVEKQNNRPRNNNAARQQTKQQAIKKATYRTNLYEYKCLGKFELSSTWGENAGVCHGLASRLNRVNQYRHESVAEAVWDFLGDEENDEAEELETNMKRIFLHTNHVVPTTTEEDDDDFLTSDYTHWKSYGSTTVRMLALRDEQTNQDRIVGVIPHCSWGTSLLRLGLVPPNHDKKQQTVAEMGIHAGILDIAVEYQYEGWTEEEQIINKDKQQLEEAAAKDKPQEEPAPYIKIMNMSGRICRSMRVTAGLVGGAMAEEFPARTARAGYRIAKEFPHTVRITTHMMERIATGVSLWWTAQQTSEPSRKR